MEQQKPVTTCNRFDYVRYDDEAQTKSAVAKSHFQHLEAWLSTALKDGRAKSLVMTKLEEAYMWVGKALRDDQVARTGQVELQEQRKDG